MFWPGLALIAVGGLPLLLAIRAFFRREPDDVIEVELPAGEDEDDITDEELALLRKADEQRPTPDPVAGNWRYLGLEIALRVVFAIGTVVLIAMKVFLWSPEATERRKREEDMRKLEMQVVKDARAGKTGKALQFLVTGDRSLLESAKSKGAGRTSVKGQDRRQVAVKTPGDPRPASSRP